MNGSPESLRRIPPSPRQPSVNNTPAPATPVGWNCQNSISCNGIPARAAIPRPSPVLIYAFVDARYTRPAPPVANNVAFAWNTAILPVSWSIAVTPSTSPASLRIKSRAIHSTKN